MHPITLLAAATALASFLLYSFLAALARRNSEYDPRGLPGLALVP